MPVPSSLADLSTTASSNSPAGTDAIGTSLDDYLRTTQALLKQSVARGTDIASASTITIPTNGNYCVVTGTTTITSIADSWNGRLVTLKFSGVLTLTHSAALVLTGGENIVTAAGDCVQFVNESTGVWRCVSVAKSRGSDFISVKDFGAVCDGVTDDTLAVQAALNSGFSKIMMSGTAYCTSTITVPQNVELCGDAMFPGNYGVGPTGAVLKFENTVSPCLKISGGVSQTGGGTPSVRNIAVVRIGAPPSNSIGVQISGAYLSRLDNIMSYGHAKGFQWYGQGNRSDTAVANGISCTAIGLFTGKISDVHFEIDTWPELRVTQGRAGMNGTGDLSGATSYIRITSPTGGSGGAGPNTIIFDNFQFNQGGGSTGPTYWVQFKDNQANVGNQVIYKFSNCHMENFSGLGAYINSDANSGHIQKFTVVNCTFNNEMPLFALNAATTLDQVAFIGCDLPVTTVSIGSNYVGTLRFVGNYFYNTTATFSAPPTNNWTISCLGNAWGGNSTVSISNTGWRNFKMMDNFGAYASWSDTSGSKNVEVYDSTGTAKSWTPTILLGGGAATGYSYTSSGLYQIDGKKITITFKVALSAKGSATGLLSIGNLPFPASGDSLDAPGGIISYAQNFSSLTGQLSCYFRSSTELGIRQATATGTNTVTDANLNTDSIMYGSITYFI